HARTGTEAALVGCCTHGRAGAQRRAQTPFAERCRVAMRRDADRAGERALQMRAADADLRRELVELRRFLRYVEDATGVGEPSGLRVVGSLIGPAALAGPETRGPCGRRIGKEAN